MKVALFGATGRVGSSLLNKLIEEGHEVTALVRDENRIKQAHKSLTIVKGDAKNSQDVKNTIRDTHAILSALNTDGATTLSVAIPHIIEAMYEYDISKIVTVGTAGILQSRLQPALYRFQSSESKRKTTRAAEEHLKVYKALADTSLKWTIVCPTYLPDGDETDQVIRAEKNMLPKDGKLITAGDTAKFVYNELLESNYPYCRVGICY
ncbi:NAD(P)-dependent oxidoreductase [Priestia filamentosa]|uniref:NAD(P)-dependent oxidoreductase n=1 Tax=Priestia filamentosa TaxID=1402861 RepID=UPI00031B7EC8|nr:NAD(P)H-binding protein [Priestia filamentosa]MDT3765332.1 NAD(P)H-binding protein [Priestia filamentosa]OXS67103.1 hypothetical protein B1B01_16540 [Priestia filamentosa]RJS65397.1 hypothetical protein CJ485_11735 [Priestia filamentosa]WCM16396.1 NAD(P)H-binding protein [Priestia filamentosa]WRU95830.1 NAD(P)H-binding protein [Priestia filamentosa]